jgi:Tol biopolymer transport system component
MPTLQALSLADPSLFAVGGSGSPNATGRSISDDGRYVVYGGGDNVIPGVQNYQPNIFVRDLQTGAATLVNVSTSGTAANAGSGSATMTPSGRFVVFTSNATNLVSGDTSTSSEVFVRDLTAGTTTLVSVNTSGNRGSGDSTDPVITPDGRYVAFASYARDLVSGDTSLGDQIYLRDLVAGTTARVSVGQGSGTFIASNPLVSDNGQVVVFQSKQLYMGAVTDVYVRNVVAGTTSVVSANMNGTGGGNFDSTNPVMTPDGRYVAFDSLANNLVPNDKNGAEDVFVRDLVAGKTTLVSANSSGAAANGASGVNGSGNNDTPAISKDGRYVAFTSGATDFTGGQYNPLAIFVRDLTTNTTTEVSVSTTGGQPNNYSEHAFMTPDGNYVGFESYAGNLVNMSSAPAYENIFVRNRSAATTALVTVSTTGSDGANGYSYYPTITADGSHVAFGSSAQNLIPQNGDNLGDTYVRDLVGQTTTLVSTHDPSLPSLTGNGDSGLQSVTSQLPQTSSDGRYVTFTSYASNLVPGDNNGASDIFVGDRQGGKVTLVSVNQAGTGSGNAGSQRPVMSADGRCVAFNSFASDLTGTPDNTNGGANVYERNLQTGMTTLVSINQSGTATAAGPSSEPVMSPDGRYIAFESDAADLTSNPDPHWTWNVFLRDVTSGTTTLVSVNTSGAAGNSWSGNYHITPDGRYVVFQSTATDLASDATSGVMNVFVRDLVAGTTTLVSVNSAGNGPANATADNAQITPDGRYVIFESAASNLVPGATTGNTQLFIRDLVKGTTTLVSMNAAGTGPGNASAQDASISADGRYVAFDSSAGDLVSGVSGANNVFVRDLVAGTTTLASVSTTGTGGNLASQYPSLSSDGRHVLFESAATNLVAGANISGTYMSDYLYLRDLTAGTTTVLDAHASVYGYIMDYTLSADGQHAAFAASGDDLSAGDFNGRGDVYAWESSATAFAISASPSTTAGTAFTFTVTAVDQFGSPATGYTGTIHFSSTDGQASLPADYTFTLADAGVHTFTAILKTAGTQTLSFTDTSTPIFFGAHARVSVSAAAASTFAIAGYPSPTTAGTAQNFTVMALDPYGNTATGYGGTVHFTSSDGQAVLPADYAFLSSDAGVHTFSATLKTAGSQSITGTGIDTVTASITGTQAGISVNPAAASTFSISGYPSPTTAGAAHNLTVTALDTYGNVATGYTGTIHFTSSDNQALLPRDYAFTSGDAGIHTFSATLKTAASQSITGTDTVTASITGTQAGISVNPAAAGIFSIGGYPSPTTGGVGHNFTVTALDAYGNVATGYTGSIHFTSSDGQAALPADYTFLNSDAGIRTFSATLKTAGSQSITGTDTVTASITGKQAGITVNPAAANTFSISGYPSPTTAGSAHNLTVTALDAYGNVATGYTGTIHFTSSDNQAVLPTDYGFTSADAGVHTFSATLKTAAGQSITGTDTVTASITGTQTGISVNPAAASTFSISGYPSPTTAGGNHGFSVTALDPYGNVATGYTGTVHFTSSDSLAALPADYTFTAADAGVHSVSATLKTAGTQSLTATDTTIATITGTQTGITVNPATASSLKVAGFPSTTGAGLSHSVTVTALDAYGNVATSYSGTVHFTSSDGQAVLPADYSYTAADAGMHSFSVTLKTAGSRSITGTDSLTTSITGSQSGITVTPAAASILTVSGFPSSTTAGVSHNVTVTALDAYGNVATGYAGTVHFTSSDGQAALPADYTYVAADAGSHTFTATLKTAGTQSITATDTATSSISGQQPGISVNAATASTLAVAGYPSTTAGTKQNFTVTALDAYGNVAVGYTGTIHFKSSDGQASLPADYTFTASDAGAHTFSATLKTAGTQSITASDTVTATITGTQSGISVSAAPATHFSISAPASAKTGNPFKITVTALDAYGNVAVSYRGTVHITSSDRKAVLPGNYTFVASDNGAHTFTVTLRTTGTQTMTSTDTVTASTMGKTSVTVTK